MAALDTLYPPSVTGVPPDLTTPNARYRRSVIVVLVSLILFMLFYLALAAASAFILYEAVIYPMGEVNRGTMLLKAGSVAMAGMLFFFVLKGLFKSRRMEDELHVEIKEADHPELFQFVRQLCQETKAPLPYRIFLSPEVNAAVFYNSSLLNLLFPVRKNLLIGLGLVNSLTLSEFKAVLAHEFGHFAQSSMRLGSYVYMANRVIADMVYKRDAFDNMLAQWRRMEIRIAIFGHALYGIVWLLRKILAGAFQGINFVERALSRQMEFHADLVAVSVTGSDSLIHALARLEFASESLVQAMEDLKDAADHRLYTRDLFYHQARAADHLRAVNQKEDLGLPPPLPKEAGVRSQVFQPGDEGIPSMWSSHPSNYDREENAKRQYVRSIEDTRSPWLLFRNSEALRETMTRRCYQEMLELSRDAAFSDPETVQAFIDEEHAETTQDSRYLGLYDGRFVEPGDLSALVKAVHEQPWSAATLEAAASRLYNAEFKDWLELHHKREGEHALLGALNDGEIKPKGKTFPFRGADYRMPDVKRLLETVDKELEEDSEWLKQFDAQAFQAHYQMAAQLGSELEKELWARYHFHLAVQGILREMNIQRAIIESLLESMRQRQGGLSEADLKALIGYLREARAAIWKALTTAHTLGLPPLRNMAAGQPLGQFLLEEPVVSDLPADGNSISGEWVQNMMQQLVRIQDRSRRIHFKSLGAILGLQEKIAEQWRTQQFEVPKE